MSERPSYPPSRHILRHLRLIHRFPSSSGGGIEVTMPILDDLCDEQGSLRIGPISTLIDSAAGVFSVRQVTPDWVATLGLSTVVQRAARGDQVVARCDPIRVGRNNVTTEITVSDDEGQVATSICTYARLPTRSDNPSVGYFNDDFMDYAEADEEPRIPFDDYLRIERDPEAPILRLPHHSRIYNSFGSIQGGVVVALGETAAVHAAEQRWGSPASCVSIQVNYLAQAKSGPFTVYADVLHDDGRSATCQVRIVDSGNDDRLLDIATATVLRR